jgi:hypothetical protein
VNDADTRAPKQQIGVPFKPGQSGNPKGRPVGAKQKIGEAFVDALHEDFIEHGAKAIVACREAKPEVYLQVIAKIVPKELNIKGDGLAAFVKLWDAISNGMAGRLAEEQGQPQTLRDERPAGHA